MKVKKVEMCASRCPLECDSIHFEFLAETSQNKRQSVIRIFYSSLRYLEITEIPESTWTEVVARFGDTLGKCLAYDLKVCSFQLLSFSFGLKGLFAGFSLLSSCEIVHLLIEMACLAAEKCFIKA